MLIFTSFPINLVKCFYRRRFLTALFDIKETFLSRNLFLQVDLGWRFPLLTKGKMISNNYTVMETLNRLWVSLGEDGTKEVGESLPYLRNGRRIGREDGFILLAAGTFVSIPLQLLFQAVSGEVSGYHQSSP